MRPSEQDIQEDHQTRQDGRFELFFCDPVGTRYRGGHRFGEVRAESSYVIEYIQLTW